MTDRIQTHLEKDTLSPVATIFLLILLRIAGFFEHEDVDTGFLANNSGQPNDLDSLDFEEIVRQTFSTMPLCPESPGSPLEFVPSPETLWSAEVNISVNGLDMTLLVPENAAACIIDTMTRTIQWRLANGRVMPAEGWERYVTSVNYTFPLEEPSNLYEIGINRSVHHLPYGLCTPSRSGMITASDWNSGWEYSSHGYAIGS